MSTPSRSQTNWGLFAAVGAAVAASACCTIPLLLVALGLGGAWIGTLASLEPFRPLFITLAAGALGYAGYREWRMSRQPDCDCEVGMPDKSRRMLLAIGFVAVVGLIASPWAIRSAESADAAAVPVLAAATTKQVILEVEGMTCASCNVTVRRALMSLNGVVDARVTFEPPQAIVTYDPTKVSVERLTQATADAGYPSRPRNRM